MISHIVSAMAIAKTDLLTIAFHLLSLTGSDKLRAPMATGSFIAVLAALLALHAVLESSHFVAT